MIRRSASPCLAPLLLAVLALVGGGRAVVAQTPDPSSNTADASPSGPQESAVTTDSPAPSASPLPTDANRIRPGDLIRLDIWREPDMSGRFLVDENGEIVLPRLGRMRVTNLTPEVLQADIKLQYRRYLRNPSIDVTILRRITVNGAVNQPGLYPVDPTHSIADVLAQAGGVTPVGDREDIRVLRRGEEIQIEVAEVTRVGETPIRSGDMIFVPERSWISRHTGIVASVVSGAISLVIAFAVR